ncbi:MAG: heme exporter protein CcmD [Caulobacteraceae bacterium]|nr:heme exporter protein CcmD [Caulobacter sp.]RYF94957.1 MAG: heme exporter protein CcmD [Caulobacteraceae bacterium]
MFDVQFGHYAPYIWSAFAITGLVLGWMVVDTLLAARRASDQARRQGLEEDWR